METILNDGYCPECLINGRSVSLQLNSKDLWECPESNLQLAVYGIEAVTLRFRGNGTFRGKATYGTDQIDGAILYRSEGTSTDSDGHAFSSEEEFREYLANDVEPQKELNLPDLANSHANERDGNPLTNVSSSQDPISVKISTKADTALTLQDILNLKTDLFKNAKVKMVRHKDSNKEYRELIKDKVKLLEYQKEQSKEVFKGCDYIISFIGQEGTKSLLFGIFKVNGVEKRGNHFYYDLEQVHELDYLYDRVVIEWGASAITWHQWYDKQAKEIVQILPKGYLGSFPGLLNFVLEFDELEKLVKNPDANQDWKNHLSSVNGVYLIWDTKTGDQYIGSAYGKDGVWQRWCKYAQNYHGDNKLLISRCATEPGYHRNFRFSLLQSLPSNMDKDEVIAIESLIKKKLGTRVHGLNSN